MEKNRMWLEPFFVNLSFIREVAEDQDGFKKLAKILSKGVNDLFKNETLKVAPIGYVRGCTYHNSMIIITEAQNIDEEDAKALSTRLGDNSKIVFTGDLEQMDTEFDISSSGLTYLVYRFRPETLAGHIFLPNCYRSRGAAMAARVL